MRFLLYLVRLVFDFVCFVVDCAIVQNLCDCSDSICATVQIQFVRFNLCDCSQIAVQIEIGFDLTR